MTDQQIREAARVAPGALELVRAFINTYDYEDHTERFSTPSELRDWLRENGLFGADEPASEADLARTIEVREALRALCLANNGEPLEESTLEALNSAARVSPLMIRFGGERPSELAPAAGGVPAALAALLAIVHDAMADGTWERLKVCPADDCLWAFYDRSRNRSRHWCTMSECGNRAKARRYRERHAGH